MNEAVVTDSTCLIGLERIARLELLPQLFDRIVAPPEVSREFGRTFPWLNVERPGDQTLVSALKLLVDDGEAEAIALAREHSRRLILDDREARKVAQKIGVRVIGTIGILVIARQRKIIPSLAPILGELERNQFFFGQSLKAEALRLCGE